MCYVTSRSVHTRWNCDWSSDVCSSDLCASLSQTVPWIFYQHAVNAAHNTCLSLWAKVWAPLYSPLSSWRSLQSLLRNDPRACGRMPLILSLFFGLSFYILLKLQTQDTRLKTKVFCLMSWVLGLSFLCNYLRHNPCAYCPSAFPYGKP